MESPAEKIGSKVRLTFPANPRQVRFAVGLKLPTRRAWTMCVSVGMWG
jgi:hypothetical protein